MAEDDKLVKEIEVIGAGWRRQNEYYDNVEKTLQVFWNKNSEFLKMFQRLDLTRVVELACGHGRHAEQIKTIADNIVLMDYNRENIEFCKTRFAGQSNFTFFENNGLDFQPIEDASVSSIFCYDAMVHFDHRNVQRYLQDTHRVLVPGGRALYHHSNNSYPFAKHYGQNPHSRNFMTRELFARYCLDNELKVLAQQIIPWGGGENRVADLDCLTLVER